MDRKEVAAVLDEMGTLLELQGGNPFRARAYHTASRAVDAITEDLATLVGAGTLREIDGIGVATATVITDLVTKGTSKDYDTLRKQFPAGVVEMLRIPGLGPKKAKILYEKLKISSLDALEKAARTGKLEGQEGFGKKTAENILKGIEAVRTRGDKVLFPAAEQAASPLLKALRGRKEVIRTEVAGSLRRRKEVIGDIDIIVSARDRDRQALMKFFLSLPDVREVVAAGDTRSAVILRAGINCDLRIVDDNEYPFALNYFTGSKEHNVELRARARHRGWSLNEYGFSELSSVETRGKAKRIVRCRDEEELYRALGLSYIPPELREMTGEMEAAEKGELPRLVEWEDMRGTFHCHTTESDGLHTLEQMVKGAKDLGWEYLGIADHSRAAAYAGGLSAERLRAQWKEIDRMNASLKRFRILKGTECDILADGSLDWPDSVLAGCDYVVVSVHSGFKMAETDMTRRIVRALKNKHVTMLGHPTGRLLLAREPYPVDMTTVIQAAADYGKIIEINAHPTRLDLDWRLCRFARDKGVLIAINPDAHTMEGLKDVRYGVGTARKGWLRREDILNTRPLHELLTFMKLS